MEEEKTNELTEETLDAVTGGGTFVPPTMKKWCSHCKSMVLFKVVYEDRTTREECIHCGNPI